jgi:hypothetical protein
MVPALVCIASRWCRNHEQTLRAIFPPVFLRQVFLRQVFLRQVFLRQVFLRQVFLRLGCARPFFAARRPKLKIRFLPFRQC